MIVETLAREQEYHMEVIGKLNGGKAEKAFMDAATGYEFINSKNIQESLNAYIEMLEKVKKDKGKHKMNSLLFYFLGHVLPEKLSCG